MTKKFYLIPAMLLLIGCATKSNTSSAESSKEESSQTPSSEVVSSSEQSSSTQPSSSSSSQEPLPPGEATKTITFKGSNSRTGLSSGSSLDQTGKGAQPAFYGLFNDHETLLSDITSSGCSFKYWNGSKSGISTLGIGGSADGSLTLDFSYRVTKVTLVAQTYFNCYQQDGHDVYNVDVGTKLKVNGGAVTLPGVAGETPDELTKDYEFAGEGITQLLLESTGPNEKNRLFINEMTITYIRD